MEAECIYSAIISFCGMLSGAFSSFSVVPLPRFGFFCCYSQSPLPPLFFTRDNSRTPTHSRTVQNSIIQTHHRFHYKKLILYCIYFYKQKNLNEKKIKIKLEEFERTRDQQNNDYKKCK